MMYPKCFLLVNLFAAYKNSSERARSVSPLVTSVGRLMSLIIAFGQSMLFAKYSVCAEFVAEVPLIKTLLSPGLTRTTKSAFIVPVNYPILLEAELEIVYNCNFQSLRLGLVLLTFCD